MPPSGSSKSSATLGSATSVNARGALDKIVEVTNSSVTSAEKWLSAVVGAADQNLLKYDRSVGVSLKHAIEKIDEIVSRQVAAVMQHPEFQKVEGAWRGLNYLVQKTRTNSTLKINVFNISKQKLAEDFETKTLKDTFLWKQIYSEEYDHGGGHPYGVMIGDYQFHNNDQDLTLLGNIAKVGQGALCPFVTTPSPEFFGVKSFSQLREDHTKNLDKLFDEEQYAKWRSLREKEESKYLVMTMPRVLARLPYSPDVSPARGFQTFDEIGKDSKGRPNELRDDQYCWMSSAYALGTCITRSYDETGWCVSIRGEEAGGRIDDLPLHQFKSVEGGTKTKCPTEVSIPYTYEKNLSDQGFIAALHYKRSDYAVFMGGQTVHKPTKVGGKGSEKKNKDLELGARLQCVFAAARLAHASKLMLYSKVGSLLSPEDCESLLNNWVNGQYVCASKNPSKDEKRKYPFQQAQIAVVEGERAGAYDARIQVKPFLPMEELHAGIELVSEIDAGKK